MKPNVSTEETTDSISITVKKPSNRYFNELVRMTCVPDMLATYVFPDAKEVTESFGAYNAHREHCQDFIQFNDPEVKFYAVADGSTPRTGVTFAFRTAWECYSVDPNMQDTGKSKERWGKVNRLATARSTWQNFAKEKISCEKVVIAAVHAHISLPEIIDGFQDVNNMVVIAMPCCQPLELDVSPDFEYEDYGVISPERTIKVWKGYVKDGVFKPWRHKEIALSESGTCQLKGINP